MNSWDDLSIREKAEMMKVAIRNGITSLPDIKDAYNEFAEGGNLLKKGGPKKTSVNPSAQRAMRYFMDKGLTDYQAAGLVGNLMRESGMDPEAVNSSSQAYGLAQWLGSRKKALFAKYGNHPTLDNQLDFIWSELNSTHRNGLKHIKASKSAEEAARNAMGYYEFSVGPAGAIANMKKYGQDGEGSMAKGITFASRLMGQPVPASTAYSDSPQLSVAETIPQGDFSFTPMNPQVFGMQMPSYQSPVVVPEQPIIVMAEQPTLTPEQIERQRIMQEKEEQRDALNRFGLLMSMSNPQQGNDMMGVVSMLANNRFANGGRKDDPPRFQESETSYYDPETDTIYAPNSAGEYYYHELFHARPDQNYLQGISPLYTDLNDEKLIQLGADLPFVKRFEGDPGHFYSPEEIGARRSAASYMLKQAGIENIDDAFLNDARKDELKYGNNFRDLLHMYNNENLLKLDLLGTQYRNGGSIYIKPSHRGRFTRLKERTGHSATWFKEHGTPAQKKMATFELNARKWKHGYGGNLFSGITEPTQQMQVGEDYWAQLANKPTWLDTFITPINGGQLSEVVVKPTNDESWLFSLGKYARNSRKPLADSHARKVVANYLSRFDNESAKDYNARISRLADTLDIRGVQFTKNNVESGKLKNRAHYDSKSNTAYIDDIQDIFAEIAHPWQDAIGNNSMNDEFKKGNYDPDIDSRGGTRYAYPDTFEGETHGFFQPALTEWVETGKIGRSLPLLNEDLSNEKIVPKDNIEVLDSAASWNKQAIDKRVIANPHQLPLTKRIQYSIWDYPLLDKRRAYGGNLYDGISQPSQQMDNSYTYYKPLENIFVDREGNLRDPEVPRARGSILLPEVTAAYPDLKDMAGRYNIASNDAIAVANGRPVNMHLRKTVDEGAKKYAARAQDNPYLHMAEVAAGAIPLAIAAVPAVVGGGELAATALANPYVDAGITSAFAGHGLNHAINEGIDGWGDAAMTALELTPLGRLAKPMWNAGKEGLQYAAKAADNTIRYVSPSYDLYRTIGETTPRTTPTLHSFYSSDLTGSGFVENVYTGSPLFEFGQTIRTSPEKAYFMRAPKDVDVLKLGNGQFRHEVVGNEILPSGEVNGKFVSYGEPWQEFALGENSALYEFPVGPRRGPSLMATDWKGRGQKYSVDEVYDYMQQEEALRKELALIKETMGDDFLKQYSTIRRNLINEKYPALKESIDTSVHGANQTVIPNERWNFDKFLKTPFWKYSENPLSGQVQKELMMRWPEAKHLETPTIEWANAVKTPQITAENAASITPEQWTAAQDAAIVRGDMAEAQRLRDLHFQVSAPNTKTDMPLWSSSEEAFNSFDLSHFGETDSGFFGYGHYLTPIEKYAATYHPVNRKFYANIENPYIGSNDQYFNRIQYVKDRLAMRKENVMRNLRDGKLTKFSKKLGINENTSLEDAERLVDKYIADETVKWNDKYVKYADEFEGKDGVLSWRELQGIPNKQEGIYREVVVPRGEQIKSADATTYDDNGIRIPLGLRDNFKINDIRYGLLPFLGLGAAGALYRKQE